MKTERKIKSNSALEEFMNLFVLEMKYDVDFLEHRSIPDMAEALQICLEPECYEDVPLIKNVQNYANCLVMQKEKQQSTFHEEVQNYLNRTLNQGTLNWTEQEMVTWWNHYSEFEKTRILDFMEVFDGVYNHVANRNKLFQGGKQK